MDKLTLYSWNVNGIRSIMGKGFFDFIETYKPDVLCLQEIKSDETVQLSLPDYAYINLNPSLSKKGYAGTCFISRIPFVSISLGMGNLDEYLVDEYGDASREGRVINVEFDTFILVNVYTPNVKPDLSRLKFRHEVWDPLFQEHVCKLKDNKPVIICGDMNVAHQEIDLARPKENRGNAGFTDEEREGFSKLLSLGFIDSFRHFVTDGGHYTWWSNFSRARERNIGWRIDYFCVDERLIGDLKKAEIHPEVMGSDHCPVSIILKT